MSSKKTLNNLVTKSYLKKELKGLENRLTRKFLTKDDAKNFATKDDLKNFLTKDDAKNFATKDYVLRLPTREEMEIRLAQFKDEIIEMLRSFRDELFTKIDPILAEVLNSREQQEVVGYQISRIEDKVENHEQRIKKLEKTSSPA